MVGRFWYVEEASVLKHKKDSIKPNQTTFKKVSDSASADGGLSTIVELKPANPSVIPANLSVTPMDIGVHGIATDEMGMTLDSRLHGNDKTAIQSSIVNGDSSAIDLPPSWNFTYIPTPSERFKSAICSPYAILAPTLLAVIFMISMTATGNGRLHPAQLFEGASSLGNASVASVATAFQSAEDMLASVWGSLTAEASELASNAMSLLSSGSFGRPANDLATTNGTDAADPHLNANANADAGLKEPTASSVIPPEDAGKVTAEHGGVVVLPSTGSSSDQAKLEKSIQNSFSDAVTIKPNADGTTGVIKPVFRTVAGHDFLYVLVPVKATSTSAVN